MATTGVFLGKEILVYLNGVAILYSDSCDWSVNSSFAEIVHKNQGKFKEFLPVDMEATVKVSGLVAFDQTINLNELIGYQLNQTKLELKVKTDVSGDKYLKVDAYIKSVSLSAPAKEATKFDAEFQPTGTISYLQYT